MQEVEKSAMSYQVIQDTILVSQILGINSPKDLDIGLLCRIYRIKKNIGIEAAAKEIGITRHLLSDVEEGKVPQKSKLQLICDYYGKSFTLGIKLMGHI